MLFFIGKAGGSRKKLHNFPSEPQLIKFSDVLKAQMVAPGLMGPPRWGNRGEPTWWNNKAIYWSNRAHWVEKWGHFPEQ